MTDAKSPANHCLVNRAWSAVRRVASAVWRNQVFRRERFSSFIGNRPCLQASIVSVPLRTERNSRIGNTDASLQFASFGIVNANLEVLLFDCHLDFLPGQVYCRPAGQWVAVRLDRRVVDSRVDRSLTGLSGPLRGWSAYRCAQSFSARLTRSAASADLNTATASFVRPDGRFVGRRRVHSGHMYRFLAPAPQNNAPLDFCARRYSIKQKA